MRCDAGADCVVLWWMPRKFVTSVATRRYGVSMYKYMDSPAFVLCAHRGGIGFSNGLLQLLLLFLPRPRSPPHHHVLVRRMELMKNRYTWSLYLVVSRKNKSRQRPPVHHHPQSNHVAKTIDISTTAPYAIPVDGQWEFSFNK